MGNFCWGQQDKVAKARATKQGKLLESGKSITFEDVCSTPPRKNTAHVRFSTICALEPSPGDFESIGRGACRERLLYTWIFKVAKDNG